MKRSGIPRTVLFVLVIALIAVLALDTTGIIDIGSMFSVTNKANYKPYTEFAQAIVSGTVSDAVIETDRITYTTSEVTYVTDNPASPDLA